MKKLQILAITLLLIIAGTNVIVEAQCPQNKHFATRTKCNKKGLCKTTSKCEWDKGYPKKSTAKISNAVISDTVDITSDATSDTISDTTINNDNALDPALILVQPSSDEQNMVGTSSNTHAPQSFTPAEQFNGPGLVGNYFSGNKIATIHDPSGENDQSYTFENVMAISQSIRPQGVLIGSFKTPGWKPSRISCSGCKGPVTRLYGTLSRQDAADTIAETDADDDNDAQLSDDQAQELLTLATTTPADQ